MSANRTVTVVINGHEVQATPGDTILDAAKGVDVEIPTLCHDPRLDPMGSCRMCLVEIEGQRRLQPACAFRVYEGMVVTTESGRIDKHRKLLLSMLAADVRVDEDGVPAVRDETGLELRRHVERYGVGPTLARVDSPRELRIDVNPYIDFDPESCILCARCVRYCDEVEAVNAITLARRGASTTIATANQVSLLDSTCELCGGCIDTCPTGALTEKASIGTRTEEKVRTTCNFCGVGCQLDLHVQDNRVVRVTAPPPGETLNDGNLCVKGRFSFEFIHHGDRLTAPLVRGDDGQLREVSWPVAIETAARGLMAVKKRHGASGLGFISSSRCTGEENYLMQKLARAAFGTNNCHQCAAT